MILLLLDRLSLMPGWLWFERCLDHASIQATLIGAKAASGAHGGGGGARRAVAAAMGRATFRERLAHYMQFHVHVEG